VRPAERVGVRALTADVPGDLVERIAGHIEAVPGLSPLGGGVFDDEVFARVLVRSPSGGPLRHLDEPAGTVLVVDDVVARRQVERVDLIASAAGRQAPPYPARSWRRPARE